MKQKILLFLVMLLPMAVNAQFASNLEINGIYYDLGYGDLDGTGQYGYWAFVKENPNKYSGDVIIPETVKPGAGGNTFTVVGLSNDIFRGCADLTSVSFPNTMRMTEIGYCFFEGCSSLTSVKLPEGIKVLFPAFQGCTSLASINIPSTLIGIDFTAFRECTNLANITVEVDNPKYDSRENCNAIIETSSNKLMLGCKNTVIPNTVTSINSDAFSYSCPTSITIPNSMTSIAVGAFRRSSLESVTIPSTVTSIAESAFSGSNLKSITIPSTVGTVGNYAFEECTNLESVTIQGETTFGYSPFGNFSNKPCPIKTLTINSNKISNLFSECKTLATLTLGENVKEIANNAFRDCSGLTSIIVDAANSVYDSRDNCNAIIQTSTNELIFGCMNTVIPNSVTSISVGAFRGSSFESITIPNTVTSIAERAFSGSSLKSITIPSTVGTVGNYAFEECTNLESVTIQGETTFGYSPFGYFSINKSCPIKTLTINSNKITNLFSECKTLATLTLGENVKEIANNAFRDCSGLTSIIVDAANSVYDSRDNCNAIIQTSTNELIFGCMNTVIPNSVTSIGSYTFENCSGLTSITIPNSVTSIGSSAFRGCSSLSSIIVAADNSFYDSRDNCNAIISTYSNEVIVGCMNTVIPKSVTRIGSYAFSGCSGLTSITIPNSVTRIGFGAFEYCSGLNSIIIPNKVISIQSGAFNGCTVVDNVYCYANPQGLTWGGNENKNSFKSDKATLFHVHNKSEWEEAFPDANVTFVGDLPTEGDANGDTDVDETDLTEMANAIVGKPSDTYNDKAADMDGNEKVDITDIVRLIEFLLKR